MRQTEKNLREEIFNRSIEFLDVVFNSILHIEQIYSTDLFEKRSKYNLIVYECQDVEVQQYIFDFLQQISKLFHAELIDQIALTIFSSNDEQILRRYLFEFHLSVDSITNFSFAELDSIFSRCLIDLFGEKPLKDVDDDEIRWKLQIRLCRNEKLQQIEFDEKIFEQMKFVDEKIVLPIERIKSFHCQRFHLQLMRQEKVSEDFI